MMLAVLGAGLLAAVLGAWIIRGIERVGQAGLFFMPAVGYGIGANVLLAVGQHFTLLASHFRAPLVATKAWMRSFSSVGGLYFRATSSSVTPPVLSPACSKAMARW